MDGLIAGFGFLGIYVWVWRRIAMYHLSNGRRRWLAHVTGFLIAEIPALFFIAAVALSSPRENNPTPDMAGVLVGWVLFSLSVWAVLKWTSSPSSGRTFSAPLANALSPAAETTDTTAIPDSSLTITTGDTSESAGPAIVPIPKPVKKSRPKKTKSLSNSGALDVIAFSYRDSGTNEYASRTVTVRAVNADYLEGVCHARNGDRTFALNRIRGDITSIDTGEVRSPSKWAAEMRRLPNNAAVKSGKDYQSSVNPCSGWQTAVFFVGFREARRNELEEMADLAGWQVRQAFGSSLNVLVAGTLAGPGQISKAESMGTEVISEDVFLQRI